MTIYDLTQPPLIEGQACDQVIFHSAFKAFKKSYALGGLFLAALPLLLLTPKTWAADSTRAWGASSNTANQMQSSAAYHVAAGQSAQIIGTGSDTRPIYKTVTTCGVCIYNTNTGNNNTIQGNSVTSTNSGSVSAAASFTDTTLVTTNQPTTAANSVN